MPQHKYKYDKDSKTLTWETDGDKFKIVFKGLSLSKGDAWKNGRNMGEIVCVWIQTRKKYSAAPTDEKRGKPVFNVDKYDAAIDAALQLDRSLDDDAADDEKQIRSSLKVVAGKQSNPSFFVFQFGNISATVKHKSGKIWDVMVANKKVGTLEVTALPPMMGIGQMWNVDSEGKSGFRHANMKTAIKNMTEQIVMRARSAMQVDSSLAGYQEIVAAAVKKPRVTYHGILAYHRRKGPATTSYSWRIQKKIYNLRDKTDYTTKDVIKGMAFNKEDARKHMSSYAKTHNFKLSKIFDTTK